MFGHMNLAVPNPYNICIKAALSQQPWAARGNYANGPCYAEWLPCADDPPTFRRCVAGYTCNPNSCT